MPRSITSNPTSSTADTNVSDATPDSQQLVATLQRLAERAVRGRRVHGLLLGVESDDRATSVRVAAGDACPDAPYIIASITKMFTSAMVLQLVDEDRLRLDDRVAPLLPDLDLRELHIHGGVDSTDRLEVHHLLHQTSGLGDYFDGGIEDRLANGEDVPYSIQDTVDLAREAGAGFALGDRDGRRSGYSDTNWQLLTAIVEAVTAQPYPDAVRERIVVPLALSGTYVAPGVDRPQPLVVRYRDRPLSFPNALASERGAGGIVSSLDDQLRFSRAFHGGELFDGGLRRAAPHWNRVLNATIGYGHGVMRYRLPRWATGRRVPEMFGHSGSTASFLFHIPDLGCHVAGSFNQHADPARPFRFLPRLARALEGVQRR